MRTNYHTHTYRCGHASGTEEDYVLEAIKNNISILGFSDHGPFIEDSEDYKMKFIDFPNYLSTIDKLKDKYKDNLQILKSVEIEFLPNKISFYEELLTDYKLDYLLLGQHFYFKNKIMVPYSHVLDTSFFIDYANSIKTALDTKLFKILAHPDFFAKNLFPWDYNCDKATDIIIDSAIKNTVYLEINANGIRSGLVDSPEGKRYIYPYKNFWDKVPNSYSKILINSDCHNPKDLWDNSVKKAFNLADKWHLSLSSTINL